MRTTTVLLLSTLISSAAVLAGYAHAQGASPATAKRAVVIEAKPIHETANPMSRAEGREAADSALAGALVGIVATELSMGDPIQLKLETVDMEAVSPRDRKVTGTGLLKLADDSEWLPFRYRALYDTQTQTASWGRITLGSHDQGGEAVKSGDASLAKLVRAAGSRMGQEFPQQKVALDIASARQFPAGRYQRFLAQGAASFDGQDPVQARIEGLYDPAHKRWLRVGYELGDTAYWAFDDGTAVTAAKNR